MRLTSIQPAGNYRLSRAQYQSEYTLFSPSDCPTNQDHLTGPAPYIAPNRSLSYQMLSALEVTPSMVLLARGFLLLEF